MVLLREEVAKEDQWNVEDLYTNIDAWNQHFTESFPEKDPKWPNIAEHKGKLGEGAARLKEALSQILNTQRTIEKLYTYAHLRHDEDITNDMQKAAYQKILSIIHVFAQETSWFVPELLSLSSEQIDAYLNDPQLQDFRFHLEKMIRIKKHTLSRESERLIALSGKALQTTQKAFLALNDADFKFGKVRNSREEEKELTHATYGIYIRDHDRALRQHCFKQYHSMYSDYENTLSELLLGQIQSHLFNARARNYSSCLEAALYPNNINQSVYHSLIQAVNANLDALHDYVSLRKTVLGVKELHLYDMYVPLTKELDITMPYEEGKKVVIASVSPLGKHYQDALAKGLSEQRWVDLYENKNKRSGAYSSGCYDSMPYILMNYQELLRDVFTLTHEAGHSMHSLLSRRHQPYHYSDYPIFLAEVASTFHEDLLTRFLLERTTNREEKIFLINQKIEDIRTTLFRQTMFAEFELLIHELAEKEIPITPNLLKKEYTDLNAKYYGQEIVMDSEIAIEWARIPHFYYNFYVYQYATGISAALSLSDRVVGKGEQATEDYLSFLKGGSSRYPIDLLKSAGVDMTTPEPVNQAISTFRHLVNELKELMT